ncbi:MAG: hypothetical protein J0M34_08340 [Alphaproteobacteria bacterium]|nr:hypothetical protein [Alphaproteobacteria bacterium]
MIPSISIKLIKTCFESEHYPEYFKGHDTHDSNIKFIAQIVAHTKDRDFVKQLIASGLPAGYEGNALEEIDAAMEGAIAKKFDERGVKNNTKQSVSGILLGLIEEMEGVELFHDSFSRTFISIKEKEKGRITYPLSSTAARLWLKKTYYQHRQAAIPTQAFSETLDTLHAKALFEGPKKQVFLRTARHEESVVVNLANDAGQVVIITREGYRVTTDSPVMFVKSAAMDALPVPEAGGDLKTLQTLLGLSNQTFYRVLTFIINCLKPEGPYLLLLTEGEQGSGKSFLCLLLKLLIDPSQAPKLRLPDNERDLMIQAKDNYLLVFDNVSGMRGSLSDALCSLSTGGGFSVRKLYTDDESQIFNECRPYILNGITGIANRPDLLERSVSIRLPTMPEGQRKTEEEILQQFHELRPCILGALFDIIACAVDKFNDVIAPTSVRMADAAKWIVAAEPALGVPEDTLLQALESSQHDVTVERMANNSLAVALAKTVERNAYEGTVGDLFDSLDHQQGRGDWDFPATSAHLSRSLDRLRPALEKTGIMVEFGEKKRDGRYIRIWLSEEGTFEEACKVRGEKNAKSKW